MLKLSKNVRDAVRAMIRNHPDFDGFRAFNGNFASRDLTTELALKAAQEFGLMDQVRDMVATAGTIEEMETAAMPVASVETESAPDLAETVLSPLRPFLSPVLLGQVETALAPIVMAALKPAIEIEKTVTVHVDESGAVVAAPVSNDAARIEQTTFGKLWGFPRHKHAALPVSRWDSSAAPIVDPYYVADPALIAKLTGYVENGEYFWTAGPAGTGKTTAPTQYAARTGRPFVRIAFNRTTDPIDLFGSDGLKNGNTGWKDGILTQAIRKPGTIILLDEITACPPGIAMVLQTLLDERYLNLATGEQVRCADGVAFCAADNTRGYGDESGLYAGTQQANAALVDRFAAMLYVDYMSPDREAQALANRTTAPRSACDRVVAFVNSARKLSGFDARPLSLRRMVAFVNMAGRGFDVAESFHDTVLSRLPEAEREALRQHFSAAFDVAAFTGDMGGKASAPLSDAPQQVDARKSFPDLAQD